MKQSPLRRKTPLKRGKKPLRQVKGTTTIEKLLGEGKVFRASTFNPKRKPTGELKLFKELYQQRGMKSQVSGVPLLPTSHPKFVSQFSHILPKGTYPDLRLDPRNIVLKTVEEHRLWEEKKGSLRSDPRWEWVFALEASLKEEVRKKDRQ